VLIAKQNDKVKEDDMGMACSTHGENRNACRTLVGKPEGRITLGRPRRRLEDNIKMDDGLVWTRLIWLRKRTNGGFL
jgi:hypothetical protein